MFLAVFRNHKRPDIDSASYATDAAAMESQARAQPGFVSFKSYAADDGEVVAISQWMDEDAARAWGRVEQHRGVQARGRAEYYAEYTLFACADPRVHHFTSRDPQ
ncbi:MAG: antibiotic biosynthesis monooxygenase [Croceibacterium sp.]